MSVDRGGVLCVGGLEQFDEIPGWVHEENLGSSWPGDDLVPETQSSSTQPFDLVREVVDDEVNTVPAARTWHLAVGHRTPS
jgi:hypothetical protein